MERRFEQFLILEYLPEATKRSNLPSLEMSDMFLSLLTVLFCPFKEKTLNKRLPPSY